MKHFSYLTKEEEKDIFYKAPAEFNRDTRIKEDLEYVLGATLYMPGSRKTIKQDILSDKFTSGNLSGLTSMVICLEDATSDSELSLAVDNTIEQLTSIHSTIKETSVENLPLVFIRVRNAEQMEDVIERLGDAVTVLTGFVFPKCDLTNIIDYLELLVILNSKYEQTFFGMPILETTEAIYKENRVRFLHSMKQILDSRKQYILNVRFGTTDLCGLYGIRRDSDTTVFDVGVIRDCIFDIVNIFGRANDGYTICGPVYEFFGHNKERVLKTDIRKAPYEEKGEKALLKRREIVRDHNDGLIKEVLLGKTNGLIGKTVIHPSHIQIVNSLHAVSYEEYIDAIEIIGNGSGASGSQFKNKMNESGPHGNWASKIIKQAKTYGVLREGKTYVDLLK